MNFIVILRGTYFRIGTFFPKNPYAAKPMDENNLPIVNKYICSKKEKFLQILYYLKI